MNKKIESEIAIGIIVLVAVLVGGAFLMRSEKAQAPVSESVVMQSTTPAAQTQPEQQADQQPAQPLVTGKQGVVYTNTDYGFQFTMPQDWINTNGDYLVSIDKDYPDYQVGFINFGFKTRDKNWAKLSMDKTSVMGTAEAFLIDVYTKDQWNKLQSSKGCQNNNGAGSDLCRTGVQSILGQNDKYVFAFDVPQDEPNDFAMLSAKNLGNYPYTEMLDPVKAGFKLISQNTAQQANEGAVYANTNYGFKLTLPAGWENYKAIVNDNNTGNKNVAAFIYIDLPTNDKTWPGDGNLTGYASMLGITVWSTDGYSAELKRCKTEPDPSCPGDYVLPTKSDKYIFGIMGPQAMPDDLQKGLGAADYITAVNNSFQLIGQ